MILNRTSKLAAASATLAVLLGGAATALAATGPAPSSGTVHLFVNANVKSQTTLPILVTGAIGDYGRATSIDKNGRVDPDGNYVEVVLRKGTFEVNGTGLDAAVGRARPILNTTTCSLSISGTAPAALFDGTGLYKGITGRPTLTETYALVNPRIRSGPTKGKCNLSHDVAPLSQYGAVIGAGKVRFG